MTDQSAFRLNLEQQKNRAKDLLRAARAGDPPALERMAAYADRKASDGGLEPKLADAQLVIARELGLPSWPKLKAHIDKMELEHAAIRAGGTAPDSAVKTLHVRCGSDIRPALDDAGFIGDFLEHAYPYGQGPVTNYADDLRRRATFLMDAFGAEIGSTFDELLTRLTQEERRLQASAQDYERVVLWMEHDSYDQLALVRCLASFASAGAPRVLELVDIDRFPGAEKFRGLGQLPPEAFRLLWTRRRPVTKKQLSLGARTWSALRSSDPSDLASIMRGGAAALPHLSRALHRHLQELPSVDTGLSLTERLVLEMLAERKSDLRRLFWRFTHDADPLPWMGDLGFVHVIESMALAKDPVFVRQAESNDRREDELEITDLGRHVLRGRVDWLSLDPPRRWVGGVEIDPTRPCWRWNEAEREVIRRP